MIAIVLHAWAESMSLGISFVKGGVETHHAYTMMFIFCIAGPLGIGLGWALSTLSELMQGIFEAMAAGNFIYIGCTELIVEEFSVTKHKCLKFFFYLLGVAMISCLWFLEH